MDAALLILIGQGLLLLFLELVLVVDNGLVIVLMTRGLPEKKRKLGQWLCIAQGGLLRIALIFTMGWLLTLETAIPVVSGWLEAVNGHELTYTGAIRIVGGLVLVAMSIYHMGEEARPVHEKKVKSASSIAGVMFKTFWVSLIFSIDSVMSAVGTVDNLYVAGGAVGLAAVIMMFGVTKLSEIMAKLPDLKTLGLTFVFFIGGVLFVEGIGYHIPKAVIFAPLLFAGLVQTLDILRRRARGPVGGLTKEQVLRDLSITELEQLLAQRNGNGHTETTAQQSSGVDPDANAAATS